LLLFVEFIVLRKPTILSQAVLPVPFLYPVVEITPMWWMVCRRSLLVVGLAHSKRGLRTSFIGAEVWLAHRISTCRSFVGRRAAVALHARRENYRSCQLSLCHRANYRRSDHPARPYATDYTAKCLMFVFHCHIYRPERPIERWLYLPTLEFRRPSSALSLLTAT